MLQLTPRPIATPSQTRRQSAGQQRRLLLALALLLVALVVVVVRDRQFWFGGDDPVVDADSSTPEVIHSAASVPNPSPAKAVPASRKQVAHAPASHARVAAGQTSAVAAEAGNLGSVTRTVLAPLDVEVVAGDTHRTMRPGSNATKVEITKPGSMTSAPALAASTNAAEREPITSGTGSYEANYPLLAQHMNVEGSVVLQALIGADGIVQNLQVLSGPAILATAAQQAVREWKFKPVVQNGQAVETKARITVNFNIKVADSSSKEQIATSTPLRYTYTADGASR
jgi:TonB family protein